MNWLKEKNRKDLASALSKLQLRPTRQRECVYSVLVKERDHPTAEEVYTRSKKLMPTISLATVYNCLELFSSCGLVKQVNRDRESTRYCPNLAEHAHFHCKRSGKTFDIDLPKELLKELSNYVPQEFETDAIEVNFLGERHS